MSLENITSKILQDAEDVRRTLMDEAKAQSDKVIKEAESKAAAIIDEAEAKGKADKDKLIERRKSVSVIDGKKVLLEKKQELIAECFDKAIDEILAMDKKEYVSLLAREIAKTGETSGELVFNAEEMKTVGPLVIKELEKLIPGNTIKLSEEIKNVRGGFLLQEKSIYINGTIEAMVEDMKEKLTGEIAAILFE